MQDFHGGPGHMLKGTKGRRFAVDNEFYCKGFIPRAECVQPSGPAKDPAGCPTPGPEWRRPGELSWADGLLRRLYCDSRGAFMRRDEGGFTLAYPLSCRGPFPLPALFCFARAECLGERGWWVFSFDPEGWPKFGA